MVDLDSLRPYLGEPTPARLTCLGNAALLQRPLLAVFCSQQCPGSLILQAHDLAGELARAGCATIAGFHSPVEKEMLAVLLRGQQPVVVCLGRGLERMRIPQAWKTPIQGGRMLLVSAFDGSLRRPTAASAARRNRLVGALAQAILVIHAAPGGWLEGQCAGFLRWGKPVYTLQSAHNQRLVDMGAMHLPQAAQRAQLLAPPGEHTGQDKHTHGET
jgi:predicted Rossmann fold nucleotide-binding protein DprA/Smf involved in DNA uptake